MEDAQSVLSFVRKRVTDLQSVETITRLDRGHVNYVWRISGPKKSAIVKVAPPFVASKPDVALNSDRILFEARMLQGFERDSLLKNLVSIEIRPPRLLAVFPDEKMIVMEDLGSQRELDEWIRIQESDTVLKQYAVLLGRFVSKMHISTAGGARYAEVFTNRAVQEARYANQYRIMGDVVRAAGYRQWEWVNQGAVKLGRRLLEPGICLTMGDLWPRSVLMAPVGLRIIDWEFCHYGIPAQDVAHMSAHLWMQAQCAENSTIRRRFRRFNAAFVDAYRDVVRNTSPGWLQMPEFEETHSIHFGCEILARTVGAFVSGYLYDDSRMRDQRDAAIQVAIESISGELPFYT
jgi:5-methylthioribose kinase